MTVNGVEMPKNRARRAMRVVNGIPAEEPRLHSKMLRKKNTAKAQPGTKKAVMSTLLFQRRPPITKQREGDVF